MGPETLGAFPSFPSWVSVTLHLAGSPPTSQHLQLCLGSWFSASSRCQAQRRAQWASVSHPAFVFHLHLCSASPWPSSSVHLSSFVHFSPSRRSLSSLCLSAAVSTPCLLSVFSHLRLCLSLPTSCLSLSFHLSPSLSSPPCLRVSAGPGGSGWVLDSLARAPRRTMPHSRGPSAPWQRARPALPARGPRVPRGCHGYVRRVPAPRAAAPRALGGAGPAGGARPQPQTGVRNDLLHRAFRDSVPQFPVL